MSKAVIGRLILEASTGMHGEESKILSDAWADMAQQRTELLEVLKRADLKIVKMYDGITCGCGEDYAKIDEDSIAIREAITKAEALE